MMDALWRIGLLGGLSAEQGARVVTRFRTQKVGALLAYLAYHHQRSHPREVLTDLLWPDADLDAGGALDYARRAVAADPLREETHADLIRLLARAGQPAAAAREYQELERVLRDELGEAPSAAVRALAEQVRDGSRTVTPVHGAGCGPAAPRAAAPAATRVRGSDDRPPPPLPVSTGPDRPSPRLPLQSPASSGARTRSPRSARCWARARRGSSPSPGPAGRARYAWPSRWPIDSPERPPGRSGLSPWRT